MHTRGLAFDVEFWDAALVGVWPGDSMTFWASGNGGLHNPYDPRWGEIGAIGKGIGLTWGGAWNDVPHFELR